MIRKGDGMSRIKGRYVAQIEIDFDIKRVPGMLSLNEMTERLKSGEFANAIREEIVDISEGAVTITQLYSDLYEVDDDGTD